MAPARGICDPLGTCSSYEGVSINNQPIPFPMDRDGHDFHTLFQYMYYTWVQNCIESFFNKILNVKWTGPRSLVDKRVDS